MIQSKLKDTVYINDIKSKLIATVYIKCNTKKVTYLTKYKLKVCVEYL